MVIDLRRITALRDIRAAGGGLEIGASATHAAVIDAPLVQQRWPLLVECGRQIGDLQVRNAGTIGGSVVHADPAADWPAALLALGATLQVAGPQGARSVPADGFFLGALESAVRPGEILTSIVAPERYTLRLEGQSTVGHVAATALLRLEGHAAGTRVVYDSDAKISGLIATVGGRLLDVVAKKMVGEFFARLAAELA